jgi:hypothetical protein
VRRPVQAQVAVVALPLFGGAEDGVGFAYVDEALGGGGVGGVAVGVGEFGEVVECAGGGAGWLARILLLSQDQ